MSRYVNSTTPGKVWAINVFKPTGRPAYVSATLGEVGDGGNSFTTVLFQDPMVRVQLSGNNTAKNRAHALKVLHDNLVENGFMDAGEEFPIF